MSVEFLIGNLDNSQPQFEIDANNFKLAMLHQWPDAEISGADNSETLILSWRIAFDDYLVAGEFRFDQNILVVMATIEYAAKFARWYRQIVPVQHKLLIVDFLGNYSPLEIGFETTETQIISTFS